MHARPTRGGRAPARYLRWYDASSWPSRLPAEYAEAVNEHTVMTSGFESGSGAQSFLARGV
jgi:hypothetical protein